MVRKKSPKTGAEPLDFRRLTLRGSPNEYLVAPPDLCREAEPHRPADVYDVASAELRDALLHVISRHSRTEIRGMDEEAKAYEFVQYSPVLNFEDLISVRVIPQGHTHATLAIYSRSRTGYYDFGVNRKRIEAWLEELDGEIIR